jgi:tetratricopeptide (TPR) repeat protein
MSFGANLHAEREGDEALGLYGVLTEKDWSSRLESCYLTADQKQQVRETVYVTLVSLADFYIRWRGGEPNSAERSLDLLQRAQAFHQPTRAFYFVRSACRRQQGDTAAADKDDKQFKAAAAQTAWDYYLPGHSAGWRGDLDEAIRSYQAALRIQPDHYNSLFFLAMYLDMDEVNRRPEAIAYFTGCIALRPNHFDVYRHRGGCYYHLGQFDDALTDWRQQVRIGPLFGPDHSNLGLALRQKGKLDEAIAAHREAIRLKPDYVDAHLNLGVALAGRGKLDEAIAAAREAIRLKPDYGCAYNNLSEALLSKGEIDQAISASKEAVRLGPNHVDHRRNLGEHLVAKGAFAEAVACMSATLRLYPDDASAHEHIAWLLATCPDSQLRDIPKSVALARRAVALARRAVELAPQKRACWNTLGAVEYRAGDWRAAIEAMEKSESLASGGYFDFNGFLLAMARWQLGQRDEARTWYDKSVDWMEKKDPKNCELVRFRAEAAALLGLGDLPADVFARR